MQPRFLGFPLLLSLLTACANAPHSPPIDPETPEVMELLEELVRLHEAALQVVTDQTRSGRRSQSELTQTRVALLEAKIRLARARTGAR